MYHLCVKFTFGWRYIRVKELADGTYLTKDKVTAKTWKTYEGAAKYAREHGFSQNMIQIKEAVYCRDTVGLYSS